MPISLIVAVANGGVIGYKGKMPWGRLPRDLSHFKNITNGKTIVIGYTTLVSIGKELPGRTVLVLTHNPHKLDSFLWCKATSVSAVLELAKTEHVIIAGGETVYRKFLPYATVAHITRIAECFKGDTFFPRLSLSEWELESSEPWAKDEGKTPYPLQFERWRRIEKPTI